MSFTDIVPHQPRVSLVKLDKTTSLFAQSPNCSRPLVQHSQSGKILFIKPNGMLLHGCSPFCIGYAEIACSCHGLGVVSCINFLLLSRGLFVFQDIRGCTGYSTVVSTGWTSLPHFSIYGVGFRDEHIADSQLHLLHESL